VLCSRCSASSLPDALLISLSVSVQHRLRFYQGVHTPLPQDGADGDSLQEATGGRSQFLQASSWGPLRKGSGASSGSPQHSPLGYQQVRSSSIW